MEWSARYRSKTAHDIPVADSFVRLWSATGPTNRLEIARLFGPIISAGFVYPYIALMPDWHPGERSVVGSVVPTKDVLLPEVVGGDIGCGMTAVRLPLEAGEIDGQLEEIGSELRARIPVGTAFNADVTDRVRNNPIWGKELNADISNRTLRKLMRQFGSLGGGNHFLEIQRDQDQQAWAMLHSGSRYLGVQVRDFYVAQGALQREVDVKLYRRVPHLMPGQLADQYLEDMAIVIEFAKESRKEMLLRTLEVFGAKFPMVDQVALAKAAVDISHNYVAREQHGDEWLLVHRKGAVHLPLGSWGLIPGSMGTRSFVVEGRGILQSYSSCSHGAGRAMSRSAASRMISHKVFQNSMEGVVCKHESMLIDEAPAAYKDINVVMRGQRDLVKILFELKPLLSIKGLLSRICG